MIPDNVIDQINEVIDLAQIVREFGVELRKVAGGFLGLCPFHQERTPSFRVNATGKLRNTWHCFGCSAGGGAANFLMKIEGMTFPEAIRMLADRAGVPIDDNRPKSRIERVANQEDVECSAWWWRHQWSDVRGLMDKEIESDAIDIEFADCCGRMLRWIDALKHSERLQHFQLHARGTEIMQWRGIKASEAELLKMIAAAAPGF